VRCKQVREKLAEYQLGALDDAEAAAIAKHLAKCADCRAELQALERTAELLAPAEAVSPPHDLWPGVRERLRPRRAWSWDTLAVHWQPALAGGVALLVIILGLAWMALRPPATEPSSESLASEYQQQQIIAQWEQPLADDAALGMMFASLGNGEEGARW